MGSYEALAPRVRAVGHGARFSVRSVARPVAAVVVGIGLALFAQLPDRRPFDLFLGSVTAGAVADHVRTAGQRGRVSASEREVGRRLAEAEAHLGDLVERLPAAVYRDRYRA